MKNLFCNDKECEICNAFSFIKQYFNTQKEVKINEEKRIQK